MARIPAYCDSAKITIVKSFTLQAPGEKNLKKTKVTNVRISLFEKHDRYCPGIFGKSMAKFLAKCTFCNNLKL